MSSGWRIFSSVAKGTVNASNGISRAMSGGIESAAANRGSRAARSGILAPGDPPPPPNSGDFYDYRGVAVPNQLKPLVGPFALGVGIDPRKGNRQQLGLLADDLAQHAAVVGPTGSGKTSSLIVPWIAAALRDGHSVVAIDVTGNLLDQMDAYRHATGPLNARVGRWDFTRPSDSVSWNWLADIQSHDGVVAAVEALIGRENPNDPQPYFAQRDRRVLRGLIEAVKATSAPSVANLVAGAADAAMMRRLAAVSSSGASRLAEVTSLPASEFGRAMSGVVNALDVFEHPGVAQVTRTEQFTLRSLTEMPSLLVIGAPLSGSRTSISVSSLMIALLTRELYTRFGHANARHVFYFIDEAPRLTGRINFEELLSVARGAGLSVVLAAQNVTQFENENERATILDNCATYISLPTPSEKSAAYFASRFGERQVSTLSASRTVGTFRTAASTQYSRGMASVPVLGKREIMDPPWGPRTAVVHARTRCPAPFLVDLSRGDL